MIICENLHKSFNKKEVIKNFSYNFPKRGLITLSGPSGCGKSTILNMISGLLKPDDGLVKHQNINIYLLNDPKLSFHRLKHFGFIFQDFKLFESETVFNNIALPLEALTNVSKKEKNRRVEDLLYLTDVNNLKNQSVNKLSGGEKQRVAICRSLINNPDVVFADEPTGALDESNARGIMEILRKVSTNALVVIVSHDLELMKEFANEIIYLKDGEIVDIEHLREVNKKEYLPIKQGKQKLKQITIPFSFLFHHSYFKMKNKKWRNLICNFVMSLSLMGVGIAFSLSSTISKNIKLAYGEMMGENRILASRKEGEKDGYGIYSTNYEEAFEISKDYKEDLDGVGAIYYNDFEKMFPDANEFHLVSNGINIYLDSLGVRDINEYRWIDDYETVSFYPNRPETFLESDIAFGLTFQMIEDICFNLHIERGVTSLSHYLLTNPIDVVLEVENILWGYYTEVSFSLKCFSLEKNPCIYHQSPSFNTYVLEEELRLPISECISGMSEYPWTLKRIFYLRCKSEVETFLKHIFYDDRYSSFIFEIGNKTYFPNFIKSKNEEDVHRLLLFYDYRNCLSVKVSNSILTNLKSADKPIFASSGGYAIYPSAFLCGFANPTYFASSEEKIEEVLDALTTLNPSQKDNLNLPSDVLSGHFSNSLGEGVTFKVNNSSLYKESKLHQVGISSKMALSLFGSLDVIGKKIYLTSNDLIKELEIIEVILDKSNSIYQCSEWSILYFQCELNVSIFSLGSYYISFLIDEKVNKDTFINKASVLYDKVDFYDPLKDFNLGVDEACSYIEISLLIFSLISIIVSILLLSVCIYLHILDNQKDIGLARCLGIPKKESTKFLFSYSIIIAFISFMSAFIDLIFFSILSDFAIGSIFQMSFTFSLDLFAIIAMFVLSMSVALISSLFFSRLIIKINPLESLKR